MLFIHSCVPMVASGKAERSGAENESRDIHPHQGLSLYGEDATQKIAETVDFLPFWYRGTRDEFFDGWRMEKDLNQCQLLPTEDVYMSASLKEKERKFIVILFPGHKPIRFYMAFPLPFMVTL